MVNSFKYRSVAIILAGIFSIFSIGIPVVIASCPMMTASVRGACCPAQPVKGVPAIQTQRDYSCCKTIIVAQRNTNEYVQTQGYAYNIEKHIFITPLIQYSAQNNFRVTSQIPLDNIHSPPLIEDIPIFTSSLLI